MVPRPLTGVGTTFDDQQRGQIGFGPVVPPAAVGAAAQAELLVEEPTVEVLVRVVEPYARVPLDQFAVADRHRLEPYRDMLCDRRVDAMHEVGVAVTSRRVLAVLAAGDVHDPSR